ncbi:NfeD family protein, partial [Clostridioides difficile]
QAMMSKKGIVTEEISPNNTGLVVVEHETWTAISIDGEKIEKGKLFSLFLSPLSYISWFYDYNVIYILKINIRFYNYIF